MWREPIGRKGGAEQTQRGVARVEAGAEKLEKKNGALAFMGAEREPSDGA